MAISDDWKEAKIGHSRNGKLEHFAEIVSFGALILLMGGIIGLGCKASGMSNSEMKSFMEKVTFDIVAGISVIYLFKKAVGLFKKNEPASLPLHSMERLLKNSEFAKWAYDLDQRARLATTNLSQPTP